MTERSSRLPLCADVSRASGEDPIGTAPHWQEVTVLELDLPVWAQLMNASGWTLAQAQVFERLRDKVEASGAGFGLLMTAPEERHAPLKVRHYTLGAGGYLRQDYQSDLPQSEWAQGLTDTLLEPGRLAHWQRRDVPADADYHVCTHGTVDAACGKYGVPVFAALKGNGLRGWRTGHFGGHRFAATAAELPSGLFWAHLTPELAVQVARREVEPSLVRSHLRGFAGLPPLAQVLDRELLVRQGWDWLSARRWAEVEGEEVTLHAVWNGEETTIHATVRERECLWLPDSSHQSDLTAVKQYVVTL